MKWTHNLHIVAKNENDLVIEDDIESETVLGDGKAGLLEHQDNDMNPTESLNKSKGKLRGMSGPISSNLDVSRYHSVYSCRTAGKLDFLPLLWKKSSY